MCYWLYLKYISINSDVYSVQNIKTWIKRFFRTKNAYSIEWMILQFKSRLFLGTQFSKILDKIWATLTIRVCYYHGNNIRFQISKAPELKSTGWFWLKVELKRTVFHLQFVLENVYLDLLTFMRRVTQYSVVGIKNRVVCIAYSRTEKTFLQDFPEFLKPRLQNFRKILKKCFVITSIISKHLTLFT